MKDKETKSKGYSKTLPFVVLLLVVLGLGAYILAKGDIASILSFLTTKHTSSSEKKEKTSLSASPTPKITPTPYPIQKGKYTYTFGWGAGTTVPKMTQLTVDPHDPDVGQKQTVSVHFTHTAPIDSINMILATDTKKNTYPMKLVDGTNTDGTWTGTWDIADPHQYTYILTPVVSVAGKEIPYKTVIREQQ